jgi:preprotein translocase subunit SecE
MRRAGESAETGISVTEEREARSLNLVQATGEYLREVRGEMRKVTWPDRQETIRLSGIVLAVTAALTVLLYTFDYFFSYIIRQLVALFVS